jgi:hypothetical protein
MRYSVVTRVNLYFGYLSPSIHPHPHPLPLLSSLPSSPLSPSLHKLTSTTEADCKGVDNNISVSIFLDADADYKISIDYTIGSAATGNPATPGSDFIASSGTVTFGAHVRAVILQCGLQCSYSECSVVTEARLLCVVTYFACFYPRTTSRPSIWSSKQTGCTR